MSIRLSSGLRASILGSYGLRAMMNYGVIEIYSGEQPVTASLAPTGTLLAYVTNNGDSFAVGTSQGALQVELTAEGPLEKSGMWEMNGVATGVAGWWRWKWNAVDTDEDSLYYPRMDGAVGESLILVTTSITPSTSVTIDDFSVNLLE